jgi:hypothetical protein
MYVDPNVAILPNGRLAGMNPNAHSHGAAGQRSLDSLSGCDCVGRSGEGDEEGVALSVYLDAVVVREGFPKEPPVLGKRLCIGITKLVKQSGRPLDVREKEGDRADRQLGHVFV